MTKKRLEELRKQEATIYVGDALYIKLSSEDSIKFNKCENIYHLVHRDMWFPLNRVYETREQVEWAKKMHATRTERFEPPMWEDIEDEYKLDFVEQPDKPIYFYVGKEYNVIFIRDVYEDELIEVFEATKGNYEKACEIVRDLFKGGK